MQSGYRRYPGNIVFYGLKVFPVRTAARWSGCGTIDSLDG
jgi:hypothetical protein